MDRFETYKAMLDFDYRDLEKKMHEIRMLDSAWELEGQLNSLTASIEAFREIVDVIHDRCHYDYTKHQDQGYPDYKSFHKDKFPDDEIPE